MRNVIFIICIFIFLPSCDWLGIGGKGDDDSAAGGEVVWRIDHGLEGQQTLTVSTQAAIDENNTYFIQNAKLKSYSLDEGTRRWSTQICQTGRTCEYSRTIPQTADRLFIDQGFTIQATVRPPGMFSGKQILPMMQKRFRVLAVP